MAITAAALIASVSVQGMSQFNSNMLQMSTQWNNLGSTVRNVMRSIEMAMAAGVGAFAMFTGTAIDEAAKIERLTATFGALGHSMDAGRAKMASLREYAQHSINTFDDLADASKRLEAAGLNSDRFVKLMDILGGVLHPGAEGINQMSEALARIASGGNFGQAMRSLRGAGIGMGDLRAEGINVSGGNRINATSEQMLTALEHIFQRKFGDMGSYLEKTMSVRFSNLHDAWNRLMASFGTAFFPMISGVLDQLTPLMNFLSKSGEIEKIGKNFANLFNGTKDGGWVRILMFGVAVLEGIPDDLKALWEHLKGFASGFAQILVSLFEIIGTGLDDLHTQLNQLRPALESIASALQIYLKAVEGINVLKFNPMDPFGVGNSAKAAMNIWDIITGKKPSAAAPGGPSAIGGARSTSALATDFEKLIGGFPGIGGPAATASRRTDELMKQFDAFMKGPKSGDIDRTKLPMFNDLHVPDTLAAIKDNTARIAATMVDFRRYALGGGDFARKGISYSEFYGMGGAAHPGAPIRVDVRSGNAKLDDALSSMFTDVLHSYHKGQGRGRR